MRAHSTELDQAANNSGRRGWLSAHRAGLILLALQVTSVGIANDELSGDQVRLIVQTTQPLERFARSLNRLVLSSGGSVEQLPLDSLQTIQHSSEVSRVPYWRPVSRKLPFENSNDTSARQQVQRHLANAAVCGERTRLCQRRVLAALQHRDAKWVVEHLDAALELSWNGRAELRAARRQLTVSRTPKPEAAETQFVEDQVWTRLCFIWSSALQAFQQTRIELDTQQLQALLETSATDFVGWCVVPAGAPADALVRHPVYKLEPAVFASPLLPGQYDVYLLAKNANSHSLPLATRVARRVTVRCGKTTRLSNLVVDPEPSAPINARSGLELTFNSVQPEHCLFVRHDTSWTTPVGRPLPNQPGHLAMGPGRYDVYVMQPKGRPVLIAAAVTVAAGQWRQVKVSSGIRLQAPSKPMRFGYDGCWSVVQPGADPHQPLARSNALERLLVATGCYDVYWKQSHYHQPVLLAADVDVQSDAIVTVRADSGVALEIANWVPRFGYEGRWGIVPAGALANELLQWSQSPDRILARPGKYDVYWQQSRNHQPFLLQSSVRVSPGQFVPVKAGSGIRLEVADGVPGFGYQGRWGVVRTDSGTNEFLFWSDNAADRLVLPPGKYDAYWQQSYSDSPLLLKSGVAVQRNRVTSVAVDHRS